MGNTLGKKRQVVDEKYTEPQGLYQHRDVDHKKLRKLILDSKLAPCYPGGDEFTLDLEECPICFLYYPSLNRSRCCMKGICTECFLQMKPHHSTRPTQCPFCKTSNYAVEYRGMRTKEEKGMEQVEEQRVIEAKIRIEQQERQDEEERMHKRHDISSSSRIMTPREIEYQVPLPSVRYGLQGDESLTSLGSRTLPAIRHPSNSRLNREDEFDLDLEDMMVMEAIWLSIQDHGSQKGPASCGTVSSEPSSSDSYASQAMTPLDASPSGGLSSAVASLAEHQHMNGDSTSVAGQNPSAFDMLAQSNSNSGAALSLPDGVNMPSGGHLLPESFEEQMMMAMAVSLAEAQTRSNTQGMTWL